MLSRVFWDMLPYWMLKKTFMTQKMIFLSMLVVSYPDVLCRILYSCYQNVDRWKFHTFFKCKCWLWVIKYYRLQLRRVGSIDIFRCLPMHFRMMRTAKVQSSSKGFLKCLPKQAWNLWSLSDTISERIPWQNLSKLNPSSKWEFLKVSIHLRGAGVLPCPFWQIRPLSIYAAISILVLFHKKYCLTSVYILVSPRCTKERLLWAFSKIYFLTILLYSLERRITILIHCRLFHWEGCKVSASSWTFAFQCDINRMCKSLSSLKKFSWVITTVFTVCYAFLFRASATIFSVLGWQWMCPNWCFM